MTVMVVVIMSRILPLVKSFDHLQAEEFDLGWMAGGEVLLKRIVSMKAWTPRETVSRSFTR